MGWTALSGSLVFADTYFNSSPNPVRPAASSSSLGVLLCAVRLTRARVVRGACHVPRAVAFLSQASISHQQHATPSAACPPPLGPLDRALQPLSYLRATHYTDLNVLVPHHRRHYSTAPPASCPMHQASPCNPPSLPNQALSEIDLNRVTVHTNKALMAPSVVPHASPPPTHYTGQYYHHLALLILSPPPRPTTTSASRSSSGCCASWPAAAPRR